MTKARGPRVLLGVTGSVAAFKAPELVRELRERGMDVAAVRTAAAARFIGDSSLEAMTGNPVGFDLFDPRGTAAFPHWMREGPLARQPYHLALAEGADLIVIAPATASVLSKMAHGLADDLLTTVLLATTRPVVVAPAMNTHMWEHAATRENIVRLASRGVEVISPGLGKMAWDSEGVGAGRLPEPAELAERIGRYLAAARQLEGRKVVVSAGGTEEPIDAVRVLSNRSTGRMGVALAEEARARGAEVVLVAAGMSVAPPAGVRVVPGRTAATMRDAMFAECRDADVVLMAAAVADWRPVAPSDRKLKKGEGAPRIELEPTEDILAALGEAALGAFRVGFALETGSGRDEGARKLREKGAHLMVVNDASEPGAGFEVETNRVTLLAPGADPVELPLLSKREVAARILDRVAELRG